MVPLKAENWSDGLPPLTRRHSPSWPHWKHACQLAKLMPIEFAWSETKAAGTRKPAGIALPCLCALTVCAGYANGSSAGARGAPSDRGAASSMKRSMSVRFSAGTGGLCERFACAGSSRPGERFACPAPATFPLRGWVPLAALPTTTKQTLRSRTHRTCCTVIRPVRCNSKLHQGRQGRACGHIDRPLWHFRCLAHVKSSVFVRTVLCKRVYGTRVRTDHAVCPVANIVLLICAAVLCKYLKRKDCAGHASQTAADVERSKQELHK